METTSAHFIGVLEKKYFSGCEETNLVKIPCKGNPDRFGSSQLPRPEPCPCSTLGQKWCCHHSVALAAFGGNCRELLTQPQVWTAGGLWFEGTGGCPSWSSRHGLKYQAMASAEWAPCLTMPGQWQPKNISPTSLLRRFSQLRNYINIEFDWQMSAFSTRDANFIAMLPEKMSVPYTPSHCFLQMEIRRECVYMCMPHLHN